MTSKNGVMFVGLCGHLSTTTMAGALALIKGLCPPTGMVSESKDLKGLPFAQMSDLVFGGWDIRPCLQLKTILKDVGIDDFRALADMAEELETVQEQRFPGITLNAGTAIEDIAEESHVFNALTITQAIDQVMDNIARFKGENHLDRLVVVNLASTEPPVKDTQDFASLSAIDRLIKENRIDRIRPSLVYAVAAIKSGAGYINFTPSEAGFSQGLAALAEECQVPVMGSDGKTGETLVKSALAPMFAARNLEVLSWEGYNILGNLDGKVLQNKENGSTKIKSKDRLLPHILGYQPHSRVSIDYVPSLGDRKTAWDFIHFQGFLNTRMSLQFIWQGCDSALAAPLVLDLARFAFLALDRQESGVMSHLASFFKSPWGITEHSLEKQFQLLKNYCAGIKENSL